MNTLESNKVCEFLAFHGVAFQSVIKSKDKESNALMHVWFIAEKHNFVKVTRGFKSLMWTDFYY